MEQMTLFDNQEGLIPLASRVRPDSLDSFVGQEHLLGKGKILRLPDQEALCQSGPFQRPLWYWRLSDYRCRY